MLDLFMQYLDVIVAAFFGLAFMARFIAAKRVSLKLTELLQSYYEGSKDGQWEAVEYEHFGRKAVPVIKEVKEVLAGILPTKTKV